MKTIAVSASKKGLDGPVGGLFGRARFFILVDPDTGEWEALDNLSNLFALRQVGVTTAQTIINKNIRTVMTGKCGARAFEKLQAAGVEVFLNTRGTVRQALERLIRGEVVPATGPNVREANEASGVTLTVKARSQGADYTLPVAGCPGRSLSEENPLPRFPGRRAE